MIEPVAPCELSFSQGSETSCIVWQSCGPLICFLLCFLYEPGLLFLPVNLLRHQSSVCRFPFLEGDIFLSLLFLKENYCYRNGHQNLSVCHSFHIAFKPCDLVFVYSRHCVLGEVSDCTSPDVSTERLEELDSERWHNFQPRFSSC